MNNINFKKDNLDKVVKEIADWKNIDPKDLDKVQNNMSKNVGEVRKAADSLDELKIAVEEALKKAKGIP
ncbi:MAG: hypothetical protein IKC79_02070 [Clostridia bacterium]|nr:hypothetical protein [Clostridia bacterium]